MNKSSRQRSDKLFELTNFDFSAFGSRSSRKIAAEDFILGFEKMLRMGKHSLLCWAMCISSISLVKVSKQSVAKRLSSLQPDFFKQLLNNALSTQLKRATRLPIKAKLLQHFEDVFLEDSTCFNLPSNLSNVFRGAYSKKGPNSTARLQLQMSLVKEAYCTIVLKSFTDNDQSHAHAIVSSLKADQLVVRDLGYWSISAFQQIAAKGAYFLSRFKFGTKLRLVGQQQWMSIAEFLQAQAKEGEHYIDCPIELGKSGKAQVRLVAVKASKSVITQRNRKARKNRDRRLRPQRDYFFYLKWTILITNVDNNIWPKPKQCIDAYALRWRIESVFKCWKSKLNLGKFFNQHRSLNANRVKISIYLILFIITQRYLKRYLKCFREILIKQKVIISPFKFADFNVLLEDQLDSWKPQELLDLVSYYCRYESRRRTTYFNKIFE